MKARYENYIAAVLYAVCDGQVKIALHMNAQFKWALACSQKEKCELSETTLRRSVKEIFGVECIPCVHFKQEITKIDGGTLRTTDFIIAKTPYQMLIPGAAMEEEILDIQYFDLEEAKALKLDAQFAGVFHEALEIILSHRQELKRVA